MILPQVHLRKDHYHTSSPLASAGGNIETTVWQQMGVLSPADLYFFGDFMFPKLKPRFVMVNSVIKYEPWISYSGETTGFGRQVLWLKNNVKTLSAMDVLAPTPMKNAVKCDTSCELQNQWVIKTLNASCTSFGEYVCWSVCSSPPFPTPLNRSGAECRPPLS